MRMNKTYILGYIMWSNLIFNGRYYLYNSRFLYLLFRLDSFYDIDIPQYLSIQTIEKNAGLIILNLPLKYTVISSWFRLRTETPRGEVKHEREKWNSLKWVWWLSSVKLICPSIAVTWPDLTWPLFSLHILSLSQVDPQCVRDQTGRTWGRVLQSHCTRSAQIIKTLLHRDNFKGYRQL